MHVSRRSFLKMMSALPAAVAIAKLSPVVAAIAPPAPIVNVPAPVNCGYGGHGNVVIDFGEHKLYCNSLVLENMNPPAVELNLHLVRPVPVFPSRPLLSLTIDEVNVDTLRWVQARVESCRSSWELPAVSTTLPAEVYIIEGKTTHHVAHLDNTFFSSYDVSQQESNGDRNEVYSLTAALSFDHAELYPV